MNDHTPLETARMTLEPLTEAHAPALFEAYSDPEVMRFWATPAHRSVADTAAMIGRLAASGERVWALVPHGGSAIGAVTFLGNPGAPGMGYILARRFWGMGLMSEAVQAALAYGFRHLGLDRAELWIDARNLASQRLAARNGFARRGAFRMIYPHETEPHEKLVYGLRREEWRPDLAPLLPRPTAYGLMPVLPVPDVRAAAEHYRDRLGFEIVFLFGDPPTYGAVALRDWMASGATIRLRRGPALAPGLTLHIDVGPEIAALHRRLVENGAEVVAPLAPTAWHTVEFAVRDLCGTVLEFSTAGRTVPIASESG